MASNNPYANRATLFDVDLLSDDAMVAGGGGEGANGVGGVGRGAARGTGTGTNAYAANPFDDDMVLVDDLDDADTSAHHGSGSGAYQMQDLNPFADSQAYGEDADDVVSLNSEYIIKDSRAPAAPDGAYEDTQSAYDIRAIVGRLFGRRRAVDVTQPRVIHVNDGAANARLAYRSNYISTTKYNAATFVPKFLLEQFSKYANLFFLFTSAIQQVPGVSPTNRYTTIGTLSVVLLVSMVKEVLEDFKRSVADNDLNYRSRSAVLRDGEFVPTRWSKICVGDIVQVRDGEAVPADLVLISSSEPEGLCYIETANLDGETNLKIKQSQPALAGTVEPHALARMHGTVLSEQPNSSLYTYEGTWQADGQEVALNPEQMLLRGATLRNTGFVNGFVVFTGHETKLMRNASAAPIKTTAVEKIINLQIVFLFAILVALSLVSSIGNVVKVATAKDHLGYLYIANRSKAALFFKDLLTYWILFSNLVPISMFVTLEIIKVYQGYMISSDLDLYHEETDTPTTVRSSSIVEELGQIEHVFSDKTGTLTRNVMEFKSCTIAGKCYIEKIPEDARAVVNNDGIEIGFHSFAEMRAALQRGNVDVDANGVAIGNTKGDTDADADTDAPVIDEFLTLLATCHTVIPETQPDASVKYQAASPDEGALVDGARTLGYEFRSRTPKTVVIEANGTTLAYELLHICEFNSTRKRMSAVFRCPDGSLRLYTKGADTVILERLHEDNPFVDATMQHLEQFAAEGLRTLCVATRIVPEDEYRAWEPVFRKAATSMGNRAAELDAAAELLERNLFLLGATAIEDKLQDGVPETIHTLQEAGIKVWVLTGDKQETAINIGMSCKLLSEDTNLLVVNEDTKAETRDNLVSKLEALHDVELTPEERQSLALVIDGQSLAFALEPDLEDHLLEIALLCRSVICCRVSPLQKALVVKLVKRKTKALLLAIGDGANDVSMIQAAHVGVGISGMEGMQAARSADFAIGQFFFLKKLLLVHGAWSYHRISQAILYSFYKNIALYMTQFWYVFANGFSGQSIIESWTLTFYNVFFTVLPPFVLGVFDQFISARFLDRYPQLYRLGQRSVFFNTSVFWSWIVNGFYHSAVLFLGSMFIYRFGNALGNGVVADHWTYGTAVYTACMLTTLGKAALVSNSWTKFTLAAIPGSFAFWLVFLPVYASVAPKVDVSDEYRGVMPHVYGSATFWATVFILPILCLLRDFLWKYYKRMYSPATYHFVQEVQKYNISDHNPRLVSFHKKIRRMRQIRRLKKFKGYAFEDGGGERLVRLYDTTVPARGV